MKGKVIKLSLKNLCAEFWDDIVYLMDDKILGSITPLVEGMNHLEILKLYFDLDAGFMQKLSLYLHLDMREAQKELMMFF